MKLVFLLFATILTFRLFSQHQLVLKDSASLKGELVSIQDGSVKFLMHGNELTFAIDDVTSIHFTPDPLVSQELEVPQIQKCTFKGNVQYFFNDNYGDKPDIGASVWVIDMNSDSFATVDTNLLLRYRSIKQCWIGRKISDVAKICEEYEWFNITSQNEYESYDRKVVEETINLEYNKATIKTTVDGNGSFSKLLSPGKYLLFVRSKNRKDLNLTEVKGRLLIKRIVIQPTQQEYEVNVRFGLEWYEDKVIDSN